MTIEGNKDGAEQCIEIAKSAMSAGNYDKAEKFLEKAERLYPTDLAKALLERIKNENKTKPQRPSQASEEGQNENIRRRKPPQQNPQREYTQEQLLAVQRIKTKCKDYYEILGKYFY